MTPVVAEVRATDLDANVMVGYLATSKKLGRLRWASRRSLRVVTLAASIVSVTVKRSSTAESSRTSACQAPK